MNPDRMLYGLFREDIEYPFYIGVTYDLNARFTTHVSGNFNTSEYIKEVQSLGIKCSIKPLAKGNKFEMMIYEIATIRTLSSLGVFILNKRGLNPQKITIPKIKNDKQKSIHNMVFEDFIFYASENKDNSIVMIKKHLAKKHKLTFGCVQGLIVNGIESYVEKFTPNNNPSQFSYGA